jgi:hypothetical protein
MMLIRRAPINLKIYLGSKTVELPDNPALFALTSRKEARHLRPTHRAGALDHLLPLGRRLDLAVLDASLGLALDAVSFEIHGKSPLVLNGCRVWLLDQSYGSDASLPEPTYLVPPQPNP